MVDIEVYETFNMHRDMGNACYFKGVINGTTYWFRALHLVAVPKKGLYKKGTQFARTGNTGKSSNPHSHLEQWRVPINTKLLYTENGVRENLVDIHKFLLLAVDEIIT